MIAATAFTAPGEARREVVAATALLEQILLDLPLLPRRVDRAPIVNLLHRAVAALGKLATTEPDDPTHLDLAATSIAIVDAARAVLLLAEAGEAGRAAIERVEAVRRSLATYQERALDRLVAAQDRLLRIRPPVEIPPAPPLRASHDVPALHHLDRAPLAPEVHVDADPAAEDDEDDDDEAKPRAPARAVPAVSPWLLQLRRLARDALEELGALGGLRRTEGDAPWSPALGRFEQRLLADLDALAALGLPVKVEGEPDVRLDVAAEALIYADDAFVPDPVRAFARAFVLGCIAGDDTARAAVLALRQSHPYTHDAQRSALSLASNPAVGRSVRALARGDDPALAALALDVLRARGEATFDLAALLSAHPDPAVRRAAAASLVSFAVGPRPPSEPANDEHRSQPPPLQRASALGMLHRMLVEERDDRVAAAIAESMLALDHGAAVVYLRGRLEGAIERPGSLAPEALPDLLRVLALAGGARDASLLARWLEGSADAAEALGWHGHPAHVEPLIDALQGSLGLPARAALGRAAAGAIHRITGIAVEPRREDVAEIRAFWEEHRERFGAAGEAPARHRFGRPYTPIASLDELIRAEVPASARERLAIEIVIATGGASWLDVRGWVATQLAEAARLREVLERRDLRAGAWPSARQG